MSAPALIVGAAPAVPDQITALLIRQLYAVRASIVTSSFIGTLVAGSLVSWRTGDPWLAGLSVAACLTALAFLPLLFAFRRRAQLGAPMALRRWERRYAILACGSSIAIGAMTARGLVASDDAVVHFILTSLSLSGVATVLRNYVRPRILLIQLAALIALPTAALLATGNPIYAVLALGGAALGYNIAKIALDLYRSAVDALAKDGQLQMRNILFEAALENMHHGLCMFDKDRCILVFNRRYLEIFGFDAAVVRAGMSLRELLEHSAAVGNHAPDSIDDVLARVVTAVSGERHVSFHHPLRNGRVLAVTHQPMPDGGWVATFDNITDRLAAETALRRAEERYAMAARATNDAIWDWELSGGQVRWSAALQSVFGHEVGSVTSCEWRQAAIHPDDRDRVVARMQGCIDGNAETWSDEYRFRRGDGTYVHVLDRGFLARDAEGNSHRMVGAMLDISKRRDAEERLAMVRSQLLHVSRVSAMGAMGAALAHELNQPLAAISNYTAAAGMLLSRESPSIDRGLEALAKVEAQAQRAGAIISRIRTMVANREASSRPENIAVLVREASSLALVGSNEAGVHCELSLPEGLVVLADKVQTQQVLFNLLRNAVEATEGLTSRKLLLSVEEANGEAIVCVQDNGPGLPDLVRANLFAPFTSTKSDGMGVGLSICRTIVEAHGGRIWAEDADGGGTRFCFSLPIAGEQPEHSATLESASA